MTTQNILINQEEFFNKLKEDFESVKTFINYIRFFFISAQHQNDFNVSFERVFKSVSDDMIKKIFSINFENFDVIVLPENNSFPEFYDSDLELLNDFINYLTTTRTIEDLCKLFDIPYKKN